MNAPQSIAVQTQPLEQSAGVTPMLSMIERAARDPSVDVDKMERLMQMQERVLARQAETAFNDAMTSAQANIGRIAADKENKQTHSWYATYASLDRVVRPVYVEHGFSLSFDTAPDAPPDTVRVVCYVSHRGGHTRTYRVDMPADGKGAKGGDVMTKTHAAGSAMSYGSRYLLKMIFNIAIGIDSDDDDGNKAANPPITEQQEAQLAEMLEATNSSKPNFLKWLGIKKLSDLPSARYDEAFAALKRKEKHK